MDGRTAGFENEKKQLSSLTVSLSPKEIKLLDRIADQSQLNRSEVMKKALFNWANNMGSYTGTDDRGQRQQGSLFMDRVLPQINVENFTFKKVVEQIVNLVSKILGAEVAGVMLYNEESKELVLQKPAFGLEEDEDINAYRVPLNGKGNAVSVFLTGVPSISNDTRSDPRFLKNFVLKYGARSTITVPLEVNTKRIGVLHVDNKKAGDFTEKDVELLSLLSSHMALLLENSAYIKNEKKQREKLKKINENLSDQQKKLRLLMDIHGKLIRKVLYGEGLSAVTQTLTEFLKSKVIVEDKHFNILCKASLEEKDRYMPEDSERLKIIKDHIGTQFREAVQKKKIACIAPLPEKGITYYRVLVPLTDKNDTLGYLSALFDAKSFGEFNMIAIEQTALVAALELVKEKNAYEIEGRIKGEFLDLLLQGDFKNEKEILERAKFLNYDISSPQLAAVLSIQKKPGSSRQDVSMCLQKPINNLVFLLDKCLPQYISLLRGNNLIVLCPANEQSRIAGKLNTVCIKVQKKYPSTQVVAGIGEPVKEIVKIKESYQKAKRVLEAGEKNNIIFNSGNAVAYSDLGIYNLIFGINNKKLLKRYVREKIGALLEHDKIKKSSLLLTLETFLATKSVIKESAERLFIHAKTMSYRLKKVEEILKTDLSDAETCLELNMAIKIHRLFK